jgi:allantoinase
MRPKTEGLELTGAVKETYLRGKRVYSRDSGFSAGEVKFAGQLLV